MTQYSSAQLLCEPERLAIAHPSLITTSWPYLEKDLYMAGIENRTFDTAGFMAKPDWDVGSPKAGQRLLGKLCPKLNSIEIR
jgi:hypothetical protein